MHNAFNSILMPYYNFIEWFCIESGFRFKRMKSKFHSSQVVTSKKKRKKKKDEADE